jgi:DnaK suppressor protein
VSKKKTLTKKKAARKKAPVKKKTPAKKQVKSTKKKSAARKAPSKKTKPKTKPKAKPKTKPKTKPKAKPKTKPKSTKTARPAKLKPPTTAPPVPKPKKVRLDATTTKIRDKLIQNQDELLAIIRSNQAIERNATEANFSNEIDLASNLEGREMMFQLTSRDRSELKMIEEAIYKIDTGTYGICEACAKPISSKRLRILPLSTLCIVCKESMEQS